MSNNVEPEHLQSPAQDASNLLADDGPISSAESLCIWCRHGENAPVTSARTRRSGQVMMYLSRLRSGAEQKCWVCEAILAAMVLWRRVDHTETESLSVVNLRFDVQRFTIGATAKLPRLQLFCLKGAPGAYKFNADTELPATASAAQTLNFIKFNLNQCLHTHSTCTNYQTQIRPGINDNWPRYIMKIEDAAFTVRMTDFDPAMQFKYVALSYCWGNQEGHFISTRDTLPRLMAGISVSELPGTLRDAIKVAINLGLSLIWIDSICIIQDDAAHWAREAANMSTVYAQSLVTIIASTASSCSQGFLETPRESSIKVARVRKQEQVAEVWARTIYDWGHHRGGPQSHESARMRWIDPVDTRGWTLQERQLSGRFINFTSGEVQWGCLSTRACECGQELYGNLYETLPVIEEWFSIVEEFCSRRLTVATDKLIAMAGVARKMSTELGAEWYAGGVWLSTGWTTLTIRSILWRRGIDSPPSSISAQYIAPTFSWASINGEPVHHGEEQFDHCSFPSKVIGVDIQHHTDDVFGRIDSAVLRIYGTLIHAKLSWDSTTDYDDLRVKIKLDDGGKDYYAGCRVDGLLEPIPLSNTLYTVGRKVTTSNSADVNFTNANVCLLLMAIYGHNQVENTAGCKSSGQLGYRADCLLLAKSIRYPGYERLGVYTLTHWDPVTILVGEEISIY